MRLSKLFFLFLLLPAAGCKSDKDELSSLSTNFKFDLKVVEKLPIYDSLATSIVKDYPLFIKKDNEKEANQAYRFKPGAFDMDAIGVLPDGVSPNIKYYYAKLGEDYIYGFDFYKDSSIKIYIRSQPTSDEQVDVEEHLSYYPIANKMRKREFPDKDTTLSKHWQYWIRFNPQGLF